MKFTCLALVLLLVVSPVFTDFDFRNLLDYHNFGFGFYFGKEDGGMNGDFSKGGNIIGKNGRINPPKPPAEIYAIRYPIYYNLGHIYRTRGRYSSSYSSDYINEYSNSYSDG
ncbi:hypothetical protein OTU49_011068 [Cherax quadricarinatus]|uniref:Uncharacterized protein n=1 Tax=Cherax quadricarinatus TaxID=27406 RepID=A0AAW0YG64_CHEQU|nr:uncharacterized protein LOC128684655 [Cherax quadricarinatus]